MAVPPLSLTIICWQSLQERLSPTFSRVRAASASSTARWPGEDRKDRGRWRQANRMAVARSLWPSNVSSSPMGKQEREKTQNRGTICMRKSYHTGPRLPLPSTGFSGWHPLAEPRASGTLRAFSLAEENTQS